MKIGILGSPKKIESIWLQQEAQKRGHKAVRFKISDFLFKVQDNKFTVVSKHNLKEFDIFLVRGLFQDYFIKNIHFNRSRESLLLLRYINDILEKPMVDGRLVKKPIILSKIATSLNLSKIGLPLPETFQFPNKDSILKNLDNMPYPVIAKDPAGKQGRNIYKLNTKTDLEKFLEPMPDIIPFLFQKFLPTDGDIRVLVIGYKAIGAMKRFVVPGDFKANISQGAKAEKFQLNPEITALAEKAAKITGTEFAGVDIIKSKNKFYIIEVNRAPQFQGFRKYTKINPTPLVIDYLEKKLAKK